MYLPPLKYVKSRAPFHIDALGILTLLGASEVDQAVGSLLSYNFTKYLPLLAANVIAQDAITKPIPGFVMYNITDGITATDIAGWLSRWVLSHDLTWHSTVLYLDRR